MLKFIVVIILIFLFYVFYNKEHFGIANTNFFKILSNNNYSIDTVKKLIISKDNKIVPYNNYFNTYESSSNCSNKLKTAIILSKDNIPVPKFKLIKKTDDVKQIINNLDLSYPIVIKPLSEYNGIGIITDNYNKNILETNCKNSLIKYNEILFEEQVEGDAYRVLVFNYKVIDIVGRKKPYVIGNGKTKLSELIKIKNKELKIKNNKYHITPNLRYIKKQGYNLDDIIKNKNVVYLTNVINRLNGCDIIKVNLSNVPKINIDLFIKSARALNILCTGIDFISDNIYTPFNENNSKIIELNSQPDIAIHIQNQNYEDEFYNNIKNQIDIL